ncbi:MAG: EAL domain-containing protein [Acidimicrobiales bacterium]
MTEAGGNQLRQHLLLEALVPMGWFNLGALVAVPLLFRLLAGPYLDPGRTWEWAGAVWAGAVLHGLGIAGHGRWWGPNSGRSMVWWERTYAAISGLNGMIWASFVLIDRTTPDRFGVDMLLLAFMVAASATAAISFAGSPLAGRSYLVGQWALYVAVALARSSLGAALTGLAVLVAGMSYQTVVHLILARTVDARVRSTVLADELAVQASTDALTGLLNRAAVVAAADAMLDRHGALSILFIDLDGFKDVNDGLGHARGDEVLATVADRLRQLVRSGDVVGRLGGDEFVVALPGGLDTSRADTVAERVIAALGEPIGDEPPVRVTASVGIAESGEAVSTEEILSRADLAMYAAKGNGGRAAQHYQLGQADRRRDQLALARELPGAIERGEIVAYAQPSVTLATGDCRGYELLARWVRPDGTTIPPDRFIPLAEHYGHDRALGRAMLIQAAEAALASGLRFGVNVTPSHLLSGRLYHDLREVLQRTGAPASRLIVEITESQVMTDITRAAAEASRIEALGAAMAIDDFGVGASSLALADQLPCTYLKTAPELALRLQSSARARAVLECVAGLGHQLGYRVVAEGIETAEVAATVAAVGIRYGQGYHFARPRPLVEVLAMPRHRYAAAGTEVPAGQPTTPAGGQSTTPAGG